MRESVSQRVSQSRRVSQSVSRRVIHAPTLPHLLSTLATLEKFSYKNQRQRTDTLVQHACGRGNEGKMLEECALNLSQISHQGGLNRGFSVALAA